VFGINWKGPENIGVRADVGDYGFGDGKIANGDGTIGFEMNSECALESDGTRPT
jgi:hypothetical protein